MTDPRIAPLAAALAQYFGPSWWPGLTDVTIIAADTTIAAEKILAALPPGWCGHAPHEGTRLIQVSIDALPMFGTRTDAGAALTAEWGEPDERGWYTPIFTATLPNVILDQEAEIARLRAIEEAARRHAFDEDTEESFIALRAALGEDHA
jgi:hypothetical protein